MTRLVNPSNPIAVRLFQTVREGGPRPSLVAVPSVGYTPDLTAFVVVRAGHGAKDCYGV